MKFEKLKRLYSEMHNTWNSIPSVHSDFALYCKRMDEYLRTVSLFEDACKEYFGRKDASFDELMDLYNKEYKRINIIREIIYYKLKTEGVVTSVEQAIYDLSSISELEEIKRKIYDKMFEDFTNRVLEECKEETGIPRKLS